MGSFGLSSLIHGAAFAAVLVWGSAETRDFARGGEQTPIIELSLASQDSMGGPTAEQALPEEVLPQPTEPLAEAALAAPEPEPVLALPSPVVTTADIILPVAIRQPPVPQAKTAMPAPDKRPAPLRKAERKPEKRDRTTTEMSRPRGVVSQRSGSGGLAASAGAAEISDYRAAVLARLARFKTYPERSRNAGITGRVGLAFTVMPSGIVSAARIATSSGDSSLDQAALDMVWQASPFPPPPVRATSLHFTPGIVYSLH